MNPCESEMEPGFRRELPRASPFALPESVEIGGRKYAVRTDFRVILEILGMLRDPDLTDGDKAEAMLRMFYPVRPAEADTDAAIEACCRFLQPLPPPSAAPVNLVDWERDFTLMAAPVNRILGCECRSLPYLHWHSFLAAWMEIGPETLYGQILRIREKLRTGKRLEKEERLFLKKNRSLVILPQRISTEEERMLEEWTKKSPLSETKGRYGQDQEIAGSR